MGCRVKSMRFVSLHNCYSATVEQDRLFGLITPKTVRYATDCDGIWRNTVDDSHAPYEHTKALNNARVELNSKGWFS